jgi:hypothetical protein
MHSLNNRIGPSTGRLLVSNTSCRADNSSCILRQRNSHIGNRYKNLPVVSIGFAILKIDTVSVTEDGAPKATIAVAFSFVRGMGAPHLEEM